MYIASESESNNVDFPEHTFFLLAIYGLIEGWLGRGA